MLWPVAMKCAPVDFQASANEATKIEHLDLDVHQTIHIKGDQTHGYWQWIGGFFTPWSEPLNNTFAGLKMSFQTTQ